jgi:hypothetical protein
VKSRAVPRCLNMSLFCSIQPSVIKLLSYKKWYEKLPAIIKRRVPHYKMVHVSPECGNCDVDEDCYVVDLVRGLTDFPTGTVITELTDLIAHACTHGHINLKLSGARVFMNHHNL